MLNTYSFDYSTQKIGFSSDLHAGHTKDFILNPRKAKTAEEFIERYVAEYNNIIGDNDIVFHLGDFTVGAGANAVVLTRNILRRLNGTKYLLWGNHNAGVKEIYYNEKLNQFGRQFEDKSVYPLFVEELKTGFLGSTVDISIRYNNQWYKIFCSHFAHRLWENSHKGVIHLCGHSHGNDAGSNINDLTAKRLDVGYENVGAVILFPDALKIMNKKKVVLLDHHNSQTT